MPRVRRTLVTVALAGWIGALVSQLAALRADEEPTETRWTNRRNLCVLLSSITMNTAVALTVYRYVRRFRRS
ncbi:hypothetical protein RBH26_06555 [Natronolimnohabitans sp. A-GB9]|uniref:hypothetical protein n=1 Tax=Natronolimnohabitans sp. A-GB9 TaxID=3069757 RepID=UPI0027AE0A5E|nr:hypothetical protein [Natronolimnohabitans sp. A-GB9]MDQ2050142.1 hypothetical protein [Natronolimnohabitans sp. A-GB9]